MIVNSQLNLVWCYRIAAFMSGAVITWLFLYFKEKMIFRRLEESFLSQELVTFLKKFFYDSKGRLSNKMYAEDFIKLRNLIEHLNQKYGLYTQTIKREITDYPIIESPSLKREDTLEKAFETQTTPPDGLQELYNPTQINDNHESPF
ncbi:hypothetical protein [Candidatus Phytoplasma oryzae]|nr:hypothetical protein PIE28_01825 [Candidatus Phytoplasma oryzae]